MENEEKPGAGRFTDEEVEEGKLLAMLGYIPPFCFLPLLKTNNAFAQEHGKQAAVLLVVEVLAFIFLTPLGDIFWKLVLLVCLAFAVIGAVRAVSGRLFRMPFLNVLAQKLK